jgi:hypothetical protein
MPWEILLLGAELEAAQSGVVRGVPDTIRTYDLQLLVEAIDWRSIT